MLVTRSKSELEICGEYSPRSSNGHSRLRRRCHAGGKPRLYEIVIVLQKSIKSTTDRINRIFNLTVTSTGEINFFLSTKKCNYLWMVSMTVRRHVPRPCIHERNNSIPYMTYPYTQNFPTVIKVHPPSDTGVSSLDFLASGMFGLFRCT